MATLLGEFARLGMVVIGSGPLEAHLKHRAERLGIQDSVRFTGRLGHADLLTYLHGCRVVAIPSIVDSAGDTEGVPTVLSESLAAGCHVVATRVSGIPDVVSDGCNGWLADPGDPADLARALRRALLHQGRGVREKARQTAAEMDWLRIARCYRANFEIAIRQRGTGR
jgi:glycosyltransferase involved in cell wall biosynthesis